MPAPVRASPATIPAAYFLIAPACPASYQLVAEGYCARYGRLGKVTSMHRIYGDYVSFVCYDRPGRIH